MIDVPEVMEVHREVTDLDTLPTCDSCHMSWPCEPYELAVALQQAQVVGVMAWHVGVDIAGDRAAAIRAMERDWAAWQELARRYNAVVARAEAAEQRVAELTELCHSSLDIFEGTLGPCDADCECIIHTLEAALAEHSESQPHRHTYGPCEAVDKRVAELEAALTEIVYVDRGYGWYCRECGMNRDGSHADGCRLEAALAGHTDSEGT